MGELYDTPAKLAGGRLLEFLGFSVQYIDECYTHDLEASYRGQTMKVEVEIKRTLYFNRILDGRYQTFDVAYRKKKNISDIFLLMNEERTRFLLTYMKNICQEKFKSTKFCRWNHGQQRFEETFYRVPRSLIAGLYEWKEGELIAESMPFK
jgi:hypothetical protein